MSEKTLQVRRDITATKQLRALASVQKESIDVEARTVEIAWASEEPYERWYGFEILDCTTSSVRLGRLSDGAALLFNHRMDQLLGVVESVTIGQDRVCRAKVRFDTSAEADVRFQQVVNRVLTKISVGYMVHEMVLERIAEEVETYRITDWEPYELSFVTVPADPTVGVGRSADDGAAVSQPRNEQRITPPVSLSATPKEQRTMEPTTQDKNQQPAGPSAEALDLKRRDAIIELGVRYADYLTLTDVQTACRDGHDAQRVQDLVIERMKTKHSDTRGAHIGMSQREAATYSIAKAVRGMLTGDWKDSGLEREASEAACRRFGGATKGILIPFDVMAAQRDFTVSTASEAGNLVSTSLRTDLFANVLRNNLSLGRLGATMLFGLGGNIDIPRKLTGTSLGFVTEVAALAETQVSTGKISLSPKRIGGYIEFSKQAVIQSALAVEPMLRQDLLDEYAVQFENAALNGSGSGANPRGLRNTSGIGAVIGGTNGAQPNWGHIVALETACADVNSEPDRSSGYLVNTRARGWFKTQQKAANLPFIWSETGTPLNGYRTEVTNNVPRNLTKGTSSGVASSLIFGSNWGSLLMATFGAIEILVDETSIAVNGMNRLIMNAFIDTGVRRAADFAVMDDALPQ